MTDDAAAPPETHRSGFVLEYDHWHGAEGSERRIVGPFAIADAAKRWMATAWVDGYDPRATIRPVQLAWDGTMSISGHITYR